jgi:hypothetical protein
MLVVSVALREVAEDEVEIHEGWRGLVLLRRSMASDASGW